LELQEKLVADFPTVPEYRRALARNHYNLGIRLTAVGQQHAAQAAYRRALELQEKLVADFPTVPEYRHELAQSYTNLGNVLTAVGQQHAAQAAYRRALELQEKLVADFPTVPVYHRDLAGSCVNFGALLTQQGQPEPSLSWFARAIALLEPLLRQEPRLVRERLFLRNAHHARAQALDKLSRYTEAVQDWDRALALNTEAARIPYLRLQRALSLVRAGQRAKAIAEADALAENKGLPGAAFYDLAKVYALAAGTVSGESTLRLAEEYAARAVALLRQAVAKGYKNIEQMKKDEDLKTLRHREDFQKLLQELEKTKP
jgi:tetratricopeptide (TPR) repeat protein